MQVSPKRLNITKKPEYSEEYGHSHFLKTVMNLALGVVLGRALGRTLQRVDTRGSQRVHLKANWSLGNLLLKTKMFT